MAPHLSRVPSVLVEALRLCVVVFFAGLGYYVSQRFDDGEPQALRPPVTAGDEVPVLLTKPGKEPGQAVGYLDDGTMVVVERARESVGPEVHVVVTSVPTTANGRMVVGRTRAHA